MAERTIPDDATALVLSFDENGIILVEVHLPEGIQDDDDPENLPTHTKMALDLITALGAIQQHYEEEPDDEEG